jgi:hypothetical protein
VYFFFDESVDYAFGEEDFDCYVRAVLICPYSAMSNLETFVRDRCSEWG